jgi:2-hydroxychromene-2-carboxylate isomerase
MDFFFFIGSTYTYLTVSRIETVAGRADVALRWRPFDVRAIMIEQNNIPFRGKPVKSRYMWRDIERRAARHGIAFVRPPQYPVDPENLANRVATIAAQEGWCAPYVRAIYDAWFLDDKAPGDVEPLKGILQRLNKDPDKVIARSETAEIKAAYAADTNEARSRGIFGSPTFVVEDEIFWGDDRLEDALEWCRTPLRL